MNEGRFTESNLNEMAEFNSVCSMISGLLLVSAPKRETKAKKSKRNSAISAFYFILKSEFIKFTVIITCFRFDAANSVFN